MDNEEDIHDGEESMPALAEASKLKWSSRKEFIISLLGYLLGLTDIWRVPYLTYRNGGGGDRLSRDFRLMLGRPLPVFVRVSTAFITPAVLMFLVLVSVFKYKPPSYGTYEYPDYARSIGWCFAIVPIVPIFIYMAWVIKHQEGSMKEETITYKQARVLQWDVFITSLSWFSNPSGIMRFASLLKPSVEWGPAEEDVKPVYRKSERHYKRSFRKLALFNLTGREGCDKLSTEFGGDRTEMEAIKKDTHV